MKNFNIDFAQSATISPTVIKEMIKSSVEEQTGKTVDRIELEVGQECVGYGMSEHYAPVFKGCTVYFQKTTNESQDKAAR